MKYKGAPLPTVFVNESDYYLHMSYVCRAAADLAKAQPTINWQAVSYAYRRLADA